MLLVRRIVAAKTKVPTVEWGQKPDKLFVRLLLKDVREPQIEIEPKRLFFKGHSAGEEYEVDIKLLRGINSTAAKHEITTKEINFELPKIRDEPCWKRLLKSKTVLPWLKRDNTHLYFNECHMKQILWREAYFYSKLHPEKSNVKTADGEKVDNTKEMVDKERKEAEEEFQRQIDAFRAKAIPRKLKRTEGTKRNKEL